MKAIFTFADINMATIYGKLACHHHGNNFVACDIT